MRTKNSVFSEWPDLLPKIRRWAQSFIRGNGDAEELSSAAMEQVCKYQERLPAKRADLEKYVYGIVRNLARQGVGRARRDEEYDERLEMPVYWRPAPQEMVVFAKELLRSINDWPADERTVFYMLADEHEWKEIADVSQMTPEALMNLIHRRRKKLETA